MPRIQAATVAEHRALQQRALLDAARALLAEPGRREGPGLGEVAARAGLARSSVYQYFGSRDELFDAVVAELLPGWAVNVQERMAGATTPGGKVRAYVESNLELVAAGDHAVLRGLAAVAPASLAHSSAVLHEQLRQPLEHALGEAGEDDPAGMSELVHAVVLTASRLVEEGRELADVMRLCDRLLAAYLDQ